jgi:hypothetical protein
MVFAVKIGLFSTSWGIASYKYLQHYLARHRFRHACVIGESRLETHVSERREYTRLCCSADQTETFQQYSNLQIHHLYLDIHILSSVRSHSCQLLRGLALMDYEPAILLSISSTSSLGAAFCTCRTTRQIPDSQAQTFKMDQFDGVLSLAPNYVRAGRFCCEDCFAIRVLPRL